MGVLTQVTMERQHNDQWCWAAVTSSVFRALQNRQITQERVVCTTLGNASCSLQPTPPECNVPFLLDIVLPQTCECSVSVQGVLAFSELQSQIDGQRHPVPISIRFETPEGQVIHYCLIKGCNTTGTGTDEEVILLDPAHMEAGESHISYKHLCDGSVLGATWTESFVID